MRIFETLGVVAERLRATMAARRQWDAVAVSAAAAQKEFVVEVKGLSGSGSECCCGSTREKGTELQ